MKANLYLCICALPASMKTLSGTKIALKLTGASFNPAENQSALFAADSNFPPSSANSGYIYFGWRIDLLSDTAGGISTNFARGAASGDGFVSSVYQNTVAGSTEPATINAYP